MPNTLQPLPSQLSKNFKIIFVIPLVIFNVVVIEEDGCIQTHPEINNLRSIAKSTGQWKQKNAHKNTSIRVILYTIICNYGLKRS